MSAGPAISCDFIGGVQSSRKCRRAQSSAIATIPRCQTAAHNHRSSAPRNRSHPRRQTAHRCASRPRRVMTLRSVIGPPSQLGRGRRHRPERHRAASAVSVDRLPARPSSAPSPGLPGSPACGRCRQRPRTGHRFRPAPWRRASRNRRGRTCGRNRDFGRFAAAVLPRHAAMLDRRAGADDAQVADSAENAAASVQAR